MKCSVETVLHITQKCTVVGAAHDFFCCCPRIMTRSEKAKSLFLRVALICSMAFNIYMINHAEYLQETLHQARQDNIVLEWQVEAATKESEKLRADIAVKKQELAEIHAKYDSTLANIAATTVNTAKIQAKLVEDAAKTAAAASSSTFGDIKKGVTEQSERIAVWFHNAVENLQK